MREELWQSFCDNMREQYGKRPDEMLPLNDRAVTLSDLELASVTAMFVAVVQSRRSGSSVSSKDEETAQDSTQSAAALDLPDPPTVASPRQTGSGVNTEIDPMLRVWDYQTEFGGGDVYTLEWEGIELQKMSQVVANMAQKFASRATQEVLKTTALAAIVSAVAFPVLLVNLANGIDNEWALVTMRSELAGVELARSLLESDEGRPVNLLGLSFGGRVVCSCLCELARHQAIWEEQQQQCEGKAQEHRQENSGQRRSKPKWRKNGDTDSNMKYKREPASIVQDVIIMGTPLFVSRSSLRACRRMVAGRFVNCYSRKDWILSLMFQYKNPNALKRGVCGTGPVKGVSRMENYDVTDIVSSWHPNYCRMVPEILDVVEWQQPTPSTPIIG